MSKREKVVCPKCGQLTYAYEGFKFERQYMERLRRCEFVEVDARLTDCCDAEVAE